MTHRPTGVLSLHFFRFLRNSFLALFFILLSASWTSAASAVALGNLNVTAQFQGSSVHVTWGSVPETYTLSDGTVLPFLGWNISGTGIVCGVSIQNARPCPFGIGTTSVDIDLTAALLGGADPVSIPFSITVAAYYLQTPYSGIYIDTFPAPPASLSMGPGDGQSGQVGKMLTNPLVVQAMRLGKNMTGGIGVSWRMTGAPQGAVGQNIASSSSEIDSSGQSKAVLTLGDQPGEYTIAASCGVCNGQQGSSITFTAHATKTLRLSALSGGGQSGRVGEALALPFVARVSDADGTPVNGITISYKIVNQPDGAQAAGPQSSNKTTGTDGTQSIDPGQAQATLTLGDKTGEYKVEATCGDCTEGSPATFTATATGPEGCCNGASIASQVNFASGNLMYDQNILSLSGTGPQVNFTLTYNSIDSTDGPLGPHWSHPYAMRITRDSDGFITLMEADGHRVIFKKSDSGLYMPIDHFGRPGVSIQKIAAGSYNLFYKDGTVYLFGTDKRLAQIQDRNGNTLTLSYQGGDLISLTETSGRITRLDYDPQHRLVRLTDPAGRLSTFSYDGSGLLRQVIDHSNQTTTYTYDDKGDMLSRTDPNNNLVTYAYDTDGHLTSAIDASGIPVIVQYQPSTHQTTITDRSGGITAYSYDLDLDQTTQIVAPDGGITAKTYDMKGNLLSVTDPAGNSTQYIHDLAGNVLSLTDPEGQTTRYTYELNFNQMTSITDPQGNVTLYSYDDHGNLLTSTDPTGGITRYAYNEAGKLIGLTNPLGRTTSFSYDAEGNLTTVTDPQGAVTTTSYDPVGNMIARTDPDGAVTQFRYDASNRLIKTTDPLGNSIFYSYDSRGNKTSQADALGRIVQYKYNYMDKLTTVIDPLGQQTTYTYDMKGNLLSVIDPRGATTAYTYDALNRLISETDPLGNSIHYVYDNRSNLISKTDAENRTVTYSYDPLNRLVEKDFSDHTAERYTYDPSGRMISAGNLSISYRFTYDPAGRVTEVSDSRGYAVKYEYDTVGNRSKLIYPDGSTVRYQYDANNRLSNLSDWANRSTAFNYDPLGRRIQLFRPNGSQSTYQYDAASRLTTLAHQTSSGELLDQFVYSYNAIGNRLSVSRPEEILTYTYDLLDRLTQATPAMLRRREGDDDQNRKPEGFTYDPVGNRLTGPSSGDRYTYNMGSQLTSDRKHQYQYDKNGNLIRKIQLAGDDRQRSSSYSYDDQNRLVQVTQQGNGTLTIVSFKYDPFGNRIEKKIMKNEEQKEAEAETYSYVYDNQAIILKTAISPGRDARATKYLQGTGIDEPLEVEQNGKPYFYQADAIGTITGLTDERQRLVEQDSYASFGELKQKEADNVKNSFTFTGREWDQEIGMYYYRARYYDAEVGRFLSVDPNLRGVNVTGTTVNILSSMTSSLKQPQRLHAFVYVENNPVNRTDPSGLASVADCSYYSRVCNSLVGGCHYECSGAPWLCKNARYLPFLVGVSGEAIDCIRGCLINEDERARLDRSNFTNSCPSCLKNSVIDSYHISCYAKCGVSPLRYPRYPQKVCK